ncbi:uncharacterized protein LOC114328532 [Diabrotica virgifera virgifera]|uniref:C2H2-type domain-containing protein n=1 Tax=Diabrotica virgifera virgifera TaxID=50390 RepID=A0ABM5IHY1_DIAVI|nr:uncharacterized protein LOC114328532 [Diabrotica virgifera virgifera]
MFYCKDCNLKPFSSQSALVTHRNAVHGAVRVQTYPIDVHANKCLDGCLISFPTVKDLRQHLARIHKILTGQEIFEFDDKDEFLKWMENINRDPRRKYIKTCELQDNEYLLVTHYDCKPVKDSISNDEDSDNSYAIQEDGESPSCTSQILVVNNLRTNLIVVTFFKNHYGHTKDMGHLEKPVSYVCRKSLSCVSKNLLKTPAQLPVRVTNADELVETDRRNNSFSEFNPGTKKRKKRMFKVKDMKKIKKSKTIIEDNSQDSDEMYSDHLYCKLSPDTTQSNDSTASNPLSINTKRTVDEAEVDVISASRDVNSEKTQLKKNIISLIKKLSEDNLELYDTNTLAQVQNSLSECCCFLGSYEIAADGESFSDDSSDANPPRISTSPPKLVWFPMKKD